MIPYRDINGYLFDEFTTPVADAKKSNLPGGYARAHYVWCSKLSGFSHLEHCKKCEYFAELKKRGLECRFEPQIPAPEYYNITKKQTI